MGADAQAPAPKPKADAAAAKPKREPTPLGAHNAGREFGPEVKQTFAQMFCLGGRPVDGPCKRIQTLVENYKRVHGDPMAKWLRTKRPTGLPTTVMYPFAGGDILTSLYAYPNLRVSVQISLEHGGPPAPLAKLKPGQALAARRWFLTMAQQLMIFGESFSVDLRKQEAAWLPGVLPLHLLGLYVHGAQPTGLRYFRVLPDGRLHYLTDADLARPAPRPTKKHHKWKRARYSRHYSNIELRFRLPGDKEDRIVRHMPADLSNGGVKRRPEILAMIKRLGPRVVLIKAASYLLWTKGFSQIRDAVFAQSKFLISDVSAPQPRYLRRQGFRIETYGTFKCVGQPTMKGFEMPWRVAFQKAKPLPFRFGYRDCKRRNVLVIGRK